MPNRTKLTPNARARFLEILSETANVTRAAEAIHLRRVYLYQVKAREPDFSAEWDKAVELGSFALEDEAVRRGCEGVDKPVYQGGQLVGMVREYSDGLLITSLKARLPDKYRERTSNEHTGKAGGPIETVSKLDLSGLTSEERAQVRAILSRSPS